MAIETLKLDQEQIFKVLRGFWDRYTQRNVLGKIWEGVAQILDNEYLQIFQANQSKAVVSVPVDWHYQWLKFDLALITDPDATHDHFFFRSVAAGGETGVALPGAVNADQVAVYINGVYLTEQTTVDYLFDVPSQTVEFSAPLTALDEIFISWIEPDDPFDRDHLQLFFEEVLTGGKSQWSSALGDAFDPFANGAYDASSATDPIQVYVNGILQPSTAYTETSDTVLDLSVALVATDHIMFRWRREEVDPEAHFHLRHTEIVSGTPSSITLPFEISTTIRGDFVFLNGVLLIKGTAYTSTATTIDLVSGTFSDGDRVEVEYFGEPFSCQCGIDPDITSIPILQNGIDSDAVEGATICLREGTDFNIVTNPDGTKTIVTTQFLTGEFWAPDVFVNERVVEDNFGKPINFTKDNSQTYKEAVQALWFAYWNGPSVEVLEESSKILLGLPFTTVESVVELIIDNGDGTFTVNLLNGTTFLIPNGLEPAFDAGDTVPAFSSLSTGVEIVDLEIDPFWFKRVAVLGELLASYTADGLPVHARMDDGGEMDDGGVFDDFGTSEEVLDSNRKLFEVLKHFVFLVIIESETLNNAGDASEVAERIADLTFFLDSLKPAYTRYLLISELFPETLTEFPNVQFPVTDEFTLQSVLAPVESQNFDDGGFFDGKGPANRFTATAGQTVFGLLGAFPYTLGSGNLKVYLNSVLQTIVADYNETDPLTVTFTSPLSGGDDVVIFEDDTTIIPFDHFIPIDEVTLVLA